MHLDDSFRTPLLFNYSFNLGSQGLRRHRCFLACEPVGAKKSDRESHFYLQGYGLSIFSTPLRVSCRFFWGSGLTNLRALTSIGRQLSGTHFGTMIVRFWRQALDVFRKVILLVHNALAS